MKKIIALFFLISSFTQAFPQEKNISLSKIWNSSAFYPEGISHLKSMNDGLHYTAIDISSEGQLLDKYAYKTGKQKKTILNLSSLEYKGKSLDIHNYCFSKNEYKIILAKDVEKIYRRSKKADYFVYNVKNKKLTPLCDFSQGKQRLADFSPNGKQIAFVRDNNIYIKNLESDSITQITYDGKKNHIINGSTDWVYEEELGFTKGFYWSPDGSKIAYYRFDESKVKQYELMKYDSLYPTVYKFKYPKAGEKNSDVTIHIYNLKNHQTTNIRTDTSFEYIPRIKWANKSQLCILLLNRHQNDLQFWMYNTNKTVKEQLTMFYEQKSNKYIYTDYQTPVFIQNGTEFIWESYKSGYNHLYLVNVQSGKSQSITSGNWNVISFYGINSNTKTVFYASTEQSVLEKNIYSIQLNGKGKKLLTPKKGYNSGTFSKGLKYFINKHSTAGQPPDYSLYNADGDLIRTLEDNKKLKQELKTYSTSKKTFFQFKNRVGIDLNGWMIKPTNFDPGKKYPVFVSVYGGPGVNTVLNKWGGWDYPWFQFLAERGYIVVSVDNRGTPHRSKKFLQSTYMQLGKLETEDQIDLAKHLASLSFVDAKRIGIMGWSYGGYMSALCILKGADYFKMAIAVAPVTNWRFYDTIYTERFMQTPQENSKGYDNNSPINFVDKLRGNLLIIHGLADDNVHFQNTAEMIKALVKANKQFDLSVYPDKNHGIYGGNTRIHLYTKMYDYIKKNL